MKKLDYTLTDTADFGGTTAVVTEVKQVVVVEGDSLRFDGTDMVAVPSPWPVGSVFLAVVPTDPATLLGYGTWAAIGAGKMLVGYDAADSDFNAAEKTGGAKTHTISVAEMPTHRHSLTGLRGLGTGTETTGYAGISAGADTSSTSTPFEIGTTGSGAAHPNLPPYIVGYFWERIA